MGLVTVVRGELNLHGTVATLGVNNLGLLCKFICSKVGERFKVAIRVKAASDVVYRQTQRPCMD